MTTDFEAKLDAWMQAVPVSASALENLRAVDLPVRARWSWLPNLARLAAAATAVVVVCVLALSLPALVRPPTGAVPPDPAAFAGDPRLSRCVAGGPAPLAAFEMTHASDYRVHLPAMGLSPELDVPDPAFVVVLGAGAQLGIGGAPGAGGGWHPSDSPSSETPGPNVHDLCVLVGADAGTADRIVYANVDTTGMRALLSPSPSELGRPASFAPDEGQADWWIDPAGLPLGSTTRTIHGFLQEQACASGTSPEGRILGPWIEYRADAIVITYRVRVIGGRCPSNPSYPVTIQLAEDLGSRSLLDGGVDPPRDAQVDPNIVLEPTVDCGPLVGTNDQKIACMAFESAALGDRLAEYATFRVAAADIACDGDVCQARPGIEARVWTIEASDLKGARFSWTCRYSAEVATCTSS